MTTKAQSRRRAPHRADHVGSLLRPKTVLDLRDRGVFDHELTEIEDVAVRALVRLQKDAGLKVFTDGEVRCQFWPYDFMGMLSGLDMKPSSRSLPFQAEHKTPPIEAHLTGSLDYPTDHPMLQHLTFLHDLVRPGDGIAKISIPGPSACHTERAGGLEPLRLLPKGDKRVMAGFITTKTGELEDIDWLKARFGEASKYLDLDQMGIAPQCSFASTERGNAITEDARCASSSWC